MRTKSNEWNGHFPTESVYCFVREVGRHLHDISPVLSVRFSMFSITNSCAFVSVNNHQVTVFCHGHHHLIVDNFLMNVLFSHRANMKRRTLSGSCGIALFVIAFICVCLAFVTPSWIVSDYRITGAKLDRLGLWTHCFRSLPDVNDDAQRRFFVGCRWVFDPFTTGYDEIRGFLIPRKLIICIYLIYLFDLIYGLVLSFTAFMIATQFFYTLCFIGMLVGMGLVLLFFLCAGPDQSYFVKLIRVSIQAERRMYSIELIRDYNMVLIAVNRLCAVRRWRFRLPRRDYLRHLGQQG